MKSLAPNTLLQNRYLIVQLIGKGGMGEVYLAVDQRLGSAVAIKRTFFSDEEALGNAFEREAKMLARLRHPALTKVSDHFTENNLQHLVMEHISGDDLSKRLEDNQKPFPVSWVLFWADQLLDALNYLHSHEPPIIHRDIKPQNLKLTNENHIILLDFGLAKNSVGETRLSTTGNVVAYTPYYASMEQIRGTGTTSRSDIYSLCATMYQLLSNTVPIDALTRADNLLNSLPDPVKPLKEINPEVPSEISDIIIKGMNVSAEQRYATAKEMQNALREAYSKSQQNMSAETVAFNVAEQNVVPAEIEKAPEVSAPEIPQSDIKTEVFSMPDLEQPVGDKTEFMPSAFDTGSAVEEKPANLGSTLPYFAVEAKNDTENISAQTEDVFNSPFSNEFDAANNTSETGYGENTVVSPIAYSFDEKSSEASNTSQETREVSAPGANITETGFSGGDNESYNPEATVPIVNLGQHISELPDQETSTFTANADQRFESENFEEETAIPVQESSAPPKKKGKGGKIFLILGILAFLGILGLGAVGAGLYIYKPELFTSATPTPEPTPTVELTPTPFEEPSPEPTTDVLLDTNSNSDIDTNSNSSDSNSDTNEEEPIKTPEQTTTRTPIPTTPKTPVPTKTKTPPVKTPTPPIKNNNKKDPAANRKRIEQ